MERPTCGTCPYWDGEATTTIYPASHHQMIPAQPQRVRGVCKRHPHSAIHKTADDWCGEHARFGEWLQQQPPVPPDPPRPARSTEVA